MKTLENNSGGALAIACLSILVAVLAIIFLPVSTLNLSAFLLFACAIPLLAVLFSKKSNSRLGEISTQKKCWWFIIAGIQLLILGVYKLMATVLPTSPSVLSPSQHLLHLLNGSELLLWIPATALLLPLCFHYWKKNQKTSLGMLVTGKVEVKSSLLINYVASVAALFVLAFIALFVCLGISYVLFGSLLPTQSLLPVIVVFLFVATYQFSSRLQRLLTYNNRSPRFFIAATVLVLSLWLVASHFFPAWHAYSVKQIFPASLLESAKLILSMGLAVIMAYLLPQYCGGRKVYQVLLACLWLPVAIFCYKHFQHTGSLPTLLNDIPHTVLTVASIALSAGLLWIMSQQKAFIALHYATLDPSENPKMRSTGRLKMVCLLMVIAGLILFSFPLESLFVLVFFIRLWPLLFVIPFVAFWACKKNKQ